MKHQIKSLSLFITFFNLVLSSNLFFQWRITDIEKRQLEKETFELIKANAELYKKIVSNYETRSISVEDEPVLQFSRYSQCQGCLSFVQQFKALKEKYGFSALVNNLKSVVCPLIKNTYDEETCKGMVDKYGFIVLESFFSKFFSGYFFCEKIDLCPVEVPKNYLISDIYAQKLLANKPKKEKEKPKDNGEVIRMLQVTDLHIDPKYEQGCSTSCKKLICCRNDSTTEKTEPLSGKFGYEGKCDIPITLFESFVDDFLNRNVDFIIWTGDNAPHDSWEGNQMAVYEIAKNIKQALDDKLKAAGKEIPVFYSLGNHEKYPNDDFKDNESEMLENMAKIFGSYLDKEAISTFKKGGYYSMKYGNTNLRIIALNCLVCDCFNFNLFNSTKEHAKGMFRWLEQELQKAEKNNEFVYILNHFPLNGGFTLTECAKRFQALFDRYEYNIRGIFSGHTHLDDVEGISQYFNKSKIIHFNFIAPQLTTYSSKLPSYRIYTIDKATMQIIDYEQIRLDLTESNKDGIAHWNSAYNASSFYKVNNMLEYDKILNCEDMGGYIVNRYSGSQYGNKQKDNENTKKRAKCTMTTNNFDEYFKCVNPKIGLNEEFLYVFTNFFIGPFEDFDD